MTKTLEIVQICRRFGPVGGMERYVWELCRELAAMGHQVHVLCESNHCTDVIKDVQIHILAKVRPKPRWLAHIRFSKHVHQWLEKNRTAKMIIHSHERTQDHHITTFHGPPFAQVKERPLWKRFSLRIKMNLWLEARELCAPQVQMIVPNSMHIRQQLEKYYPAISKKITTPIVPGVTTGKKRPPRTVSPTYGTIGFIGKEWKRKGLIKALEITSKLAKTRPNLVLIIAGPRPKDIQNLVKSLPFHVSLLGETNTQDLYPKLDVLLHPANNEPYGMVITEALSAGVPVVISDVCGAASEVYSQLGDTLALAAPITSWCNAIDLRLKQSTKNIDYQGSWHHTALSYEAIYKKIIYQARN